MKIEIEITEEDLRKAIGDKVQIAIAERINRYDSQGYIREKVKEKWMDTVNSMVQEALNESDLLRAKIAAEIEKKLRAQLAVALRYAG